MILSWALIGTVAGLLLGLTGAGGAIVAIPLFVHLTGATLREATVLSLASVASGAVLNWAIQRHNTDYKIGTLLFGFSVIGSGVFKPIKAVAPEWVILTLFIAVGLVSLVSIWRGPLHIRGESNDGLAARTWIKSSIGGFGLGGLVTMTGLGGGVILVPLLTTAFGIPLSQAAATSLYAVILTSATALALQWDSVASITSAQNLLVLAAGGVLSAILTRKVLMGMNPARLDHVRKVVLTMVILVSAISLTLNAT